MAEDDLLSVDEAIQFLGVSRATLFNLVRRYTVPRYTVPVQGKKVFFKREDLEALRQPRQLDGPAKKRVA